MTSGSCTASSTSGGGGGGAGCSTSTDTSDIPNKLAQLSEGWLELESDPGLFSSLISDFGCRGVQVEEIYDLEKPFTEQLPGVYGFIFLFNVIEERRNRARGAVTVNSALNSDSPSSLLSGDYLEDDSLLKQMFFAFQKVPNSCATHAILSVLMNCSQIDVGAMLRRLKEYTRDMSPENKGYAISNMAELARAHNNHAAPTSTWQRDQLKQASNAIRVSQRHTSTCEAFHFVSFVPINGRLIELDGLKELPIDHGAINPDQCWTEKFRKLMRQRIETPKGVEHDIRYNLMAVIPSRSEQTFTYLKHMKRNRLLLLKILQSIEFTSSFSILQDHNYTIHGEVETANCARKFAIAPGTVRLDIEAPSGGERTFTLGYHFAHRTKISSRDGSGEKEEAERPVNTAAQVTEFQLDEARQEEKEPADRFPSDQGAENSIEPEPDPDTSDRAADNPHSDVEDEDVSTDTASCASSSYNHQLSESEDCDDSGLEDGSQPACTPPPTPVITNAMASTTNAQVDRGPPVRKKRKLERKYFICKFENNQPAVTNGGENTSEQLDPVRVTDEPQQQVKSENCQQLSDQLKKEEEEKEVKVLVDHSQQTIDQLIEEDQALMGSMLQRFERYADRRTRWTYSQFEKLIKPHVMKDLISLANNLSLQITRLEVALADELRTKEKNLLDDCRRVHDYDHFINTFLAMFFEQGLLDQVLSKDVYFTPAGSSSVSVNLQASSSQTSSSTCTSSVSSSSGATQGAMTSTNGTGSSSGQPVTNGCGRTASSHRKAEQQLAQPSNHRDSISKVPVAHQPLPRNDDHADLLSNAESMILDYENSLFFPANFCVSDSLPLSTRSQPKDYDDDDDDDG